MPTCLDLYFELINLITFTSSAVREDRSPGGKHRNKKPRLDEIRAMVGSDGEVLFVPGAQEAKPTETFEDPITEGLINARPDLIPRVDGQ